MVLIVVGDIFRYLGAVLDYRDGVLILILGVVLDNLAGLWVWIDRRSSIVTGKQIGRAHV